MTGRGAAAAVAILLAATAATAEPGLSVAAGAPVETVFRWATQRCGDMNLPDSPARALRTRDGGVALVASHYLVVPLLGPDFGQLAPACAASSRGAEDADPAAFRDRVWVQALIPYEDGGRRRILGLASHEYMGWRHPGRCDAPFDGPGRRPAAFRCWYSAITLLVAEEGDWRFRPVPRAPPVAASPLPYDPGATARTGFFSVSNAILADGHATVLAYTEGLPGQPRGNCLLRAPLDDLVGGWRALSGGTFSARLSGAYGAAAAPPAPCDVVGAGVFRGAPVRSVVRVAAADGEWYVATIARDGRDGVPGGIFVTASRDLRDWRPARLLWDVPPFRSQPEAGVYYQYPSLLDHASASDLFDRVEAGEHARLHLYLTRFNLEDRRRGLDRDLVRVPVTVRPRRPRGAKTRRPDRRRATLGSPIA